jgi:mannan endo-1,4-beta-mannosidase
VCGSATGQNTSTAPTANLCSAGTPSAVTSDGGAAWLWTCSGSGGGSVAGCNALNAGVAPTGQFSVALGQIIDPNGAPFIAKGIDLFPYQIPDAGNLLGLFPGINMIRLAIQTPGDMTGVADFVAQMTAQHIVVEIEDHSAPFGDPNTLSGDLLTAQENWYTQQAALYLSNPYVWFGTANEPNNSANLQALVDQEFGIYSAIRQTGSNTIVMLETRAGYTTVGLRDISGSYALMYNVAWDIHFYGWLPNGSSDPGVINQALQGEVQDAQSITSSDGLVPIVIGEYGPSSTGFSADANGPAVVDVVDQSGYSALAWEWNAGFDDLVDTTGALTIPFGQQVAAHIAGP